MNEQNLNPPFNPTTAREAGKKGGKASAKAKKRRKLIKETIEIILDKKIKDPEMLETMKTLGIKNPTYADYLTAQIITRTAETGTMLDLCRLTDLLGESDTSDPQILVEARAILDDVPSVID